MTADQLLMKQVEDLQDELVLVKEKLVNAYTCLDLLTDNEFVEVYKQSPAILLRRLLRSSKWRRNKCYVGKITKSKLTKK